MFSKSATNRRDDGFASVIVENWPKLLTAGNSEAKYIHVLHELPDFSNALIKPAVVYGERNTLRKHAHAIYSNISRLKIFQFSDEKF